MDEMTLTTSWNEILLVYVIITYNLTDRCRKKEKYEVLYLSISKRDIVRENVLNLLKSTGYKALLMVNTILMMNV